MGKPKLTLEEWLRRAREKHGDKYDYSLITEYINNYSPIVVGCSVIEHGTFPTTFGRHLKYGCNKCAQEVRVGPRRVSLEDQIKKAREVHGDAYSYHLVKDYKRSHDPVNMYCDKPGHGVFPQSFHAHNSGQGCPECGYEKNAEMNRNKVRTKERKPPRPPIKNTEDFIKVAIEVHGDLYGYEFAYYTDRTGKLAVYCNFHNIFFLIRAVDHLQGAGCTECGYISAANKQRYTKEEFIEKARQVHGDKYNYDNFDYQGTGKDGYIWCSKNHIISGEVHGFFPQKAGNHLSGYGCTKCAKEASRLACLKPLNVYLEQLKEVHGTKYDYSLIKEYPGAHEPINIICKDHNKIFERTTTGHLAGDGCPYCEPKCMSKVENEWLDYMQVPLKYRGGSLLINGIRTRPDAYDPKTNTIYEFNGDYWHGNPEKFNPEDINPSNYSTFGELYQKTIVKANRIKEAGYNLISIWECDFYKIRKILDYFKEEM